MPAPKQSHPNNVLPTPDPAWQRSSPEDIIDPDLPIIDPHHHLWDLPRGPYLSADLHNDVSAGHKIVATVYAECTEAYWSSGPETLRSVGETAFVVQAAEDYRRSHPTGPEICRGIIGRVDMEQGTAIRPVLEAHVAAGRGRFSGIRFSTAWDADPAVRTTVRTPPAGLLYDPAVRAGMACATELGLSVDLWVYHPQLQDVVDLADAMPQASFILDHAGGPVRIGPYADRTEDAYVDWLRGMREIAQRPNVALKIGGLGMHTLGFDFAARPHAPSSQELADAWRPFVDPCIELFGVNRVMFESNFPVDGISGSYVNIWNAFKRLAGTASLSEKHAMFHDNASRIYSLGTLPPLRAPITSDNDRGKGDRHD